MNRSVTIIVPVYADWKSLSDCIESLKKNVSTLNKIIFVNDHGPEYKEIEVKIQNAISSYDNMEYYRNTKNIGFVQTCNRAVYELDKSDNDVLLLNSDTVVTEGFLDEMVDVLYSDEMVASVTPRSNNATIATVPLAAIKNKGIDPKKSYALFKRINRRLPRYSVIPTGHGFCMLIRRKLIQEYGLFDEIFGKGYGEENDFCQRLQGYGYKSVLSNRAYVFHLEARSFSLEKKNGLIEKNLQIIDRRYPLYSKQVGQYIRKARILEKQAISKDNNSMRHLAKRLSRFVKRRLKNIF